MSNNITQNLEHLNEQELGQASPTIDRSVVPPSHWLLPCHGSLWASLETVWAQLLLLHFLQWAWYSRPRKKNRNTSKGSKRQINVGRWLHGKWNKCSHQQNCHSLQDGEDRDCKRSWHGIPRVEVYLPIVWQLSPVS